jgi:hypothetical protein
MHLNEQPAAAQRICDGYHISKARLIRILESSKLTLYVSVVAMAYFAAWTSFAQYGRFLHNGLRFLRIIAHSRNSHGDIQTDITKRPQLVRAVSNMIRFLCGC